MAARRDEQGQRSRRQNASCRTSLETLRREIFIDKRHRGYNVRYCKEDLIRVLTQHSPSGKQDDPGAVMRQDLLASVFMGVTELLSVLFAVARSHPQAGTPGTLFSMPRVVFVLAVSESPGLP